MQTVNCYRLVLTGVVWVCGCSDSLQVPSLALQRLRVKLDSIVDQAITPMSSLAHADEVRPMHHHLLAFLRHLFYLKIYSATSLGLLAL